MPARLHHGPSGWSFQPLVFLPLGAKLPVSQSLHHTSKLCSPLFTYQKLFHLPTFPGKSGLLSVLYTGAGDACLPPAPGDVFLTSRVGAALAVSGPRSALPWDGDSGLSKRAAVMPATTRPPAVHLPASLLPPLRVSVPGASAPQTGFPPCSGVRGQEVLLNSLGSSGKKRRLLLSSPSSVSTCPASHTRR